ncbi:MAG: GSCFA domain-containing protein [Prevotellaceae bacterium]|nr:GSCFA domain-containing protein [Prevotellaceae bacterium]
MQLQTEIDIKPFGEKLSHTGKILLLGSCFANSMGERLHDAKFDVCINPSGVIYNPFSIASCIELLIANKEITENDLLQHNGLYYNFCYHTSFSSVEKQSALAKMNNANRQGSEFLKKTKTIIITFGSAIAYKYKKTDTIVANCHKIPACEFEKTVLTIADIAKIINLSIQKIRAINTEANFIFTVSPVRHLSDGAHANQLSKSRLLVAVDEICKNNRHCQYFPAYEIMMDELRDYRFYADDMLHPSSLAVDCIWQKFSTAAICSESLKLIEEIKKISAAKMHRTFNPDSDEHIKFIKIYFEKTKQLQAKYPFLDLTEELKYFGAQRKYDSD